MDYETIRINLTTLLTSVTNLAYVYPSRESDIEGFPCAVFDLSDVANETLTNTENLHKGVFTITLMQEVQIAGITLANQALDIATKSVVSVLENRANMTLNGSVDWIEPVLGGREEVITTSGIALMQEIRVTFWRSVSIL
jgi:hypothetical protein